MTLLVSACSTTYNNADIIERSIRSIIKSFDNLKSIDYEVVVVDSHSHDGTFQILSKMKKGLGERLRIIRRRCSRGLGMWLAFKYSKGAIILPVDMDVIYDSHKLSRIINKYVNSYFYRENYALKIGSWRPDGLFPRRVVEDVSGWRDFNWGEELDFLVRVSLTGRMKFVNVDVGREHEDFYRHIKSGLLRDILLGETRYEREFFKRIRRNLRSKLDFYFSWGYTLRKIFIRHKASKKNLVETFGATSLLLFSFLVNRLRSMKFVCFDDKLTATFYLIILLFL